MLTPSVDGKPIRASVRFTPAAGTEPLERNLGSTELPHHWILAAPDCQVEGSVAIGDLSTNFAGRGYHDHNAGAEEMSLAMRRWEWGRVHIGDRTDVYYASTPQPGKGEPQSLWITCRDGRPEEVRQLDPAVIEEEGPERTVFGIEHAPTDAGPATPTTDHAQPDHPSLPRRRPLLSSLDRRLRVQEASGRNCPYRGTGIAELLDTRHMNRWYVNWMIPYRLKWPDPEKSAARAEILSAVQPGLRRIGGVAHEVGRTSETGTHRFHGGNGCSS